MEIDVKIKKTTGETEVAKYGPQEKYQKENITRVVLKLNKKTDADLLEWLETLDNKQGTIKEILRSYISGDPLPTLKRVQDSGDGMWTVDELIDRIENR